MLYPQLLLTEYSALSNHLPEHELSVMDTEWCVVIYDKIGTHETMLLTNVIVLAELLIVSDSGFYCISRTGLIDGLFGVSRTHTRDERKAYRSW